MIQIDKNKLDKTYDEVNSYIEYYNLYGLPLVTEYSKDLDEKVAGILDYMKRLKDYNLEPDVLSLQRIVIELSGCIYYTTDKLEKLSLLSDMSRVKFKSCYNDAYTSRQGASLQQNRKYTSDQLKAIAEQESLEEELTHFIFDHAATAIKSKIDAANEVLRSCSKSLSAQITSMQRLGS